MDCRQIDKELFQYCDNTLSPELRAEFDDHLKKCQSCRNAVKLALLETEILKNGVKIPSLPEDFTSRVMNNINQHKEFASNIDEREQDKLSKTKIKKYQLLIAPAVLAAVLLLFLIIQGKTIIPGQVNIADNNMDQNSIIVEENAEKSIHEKQSPRAKTFTEAKDFDNVKIEDESQSNIEEKQANIALSQFAGNQQNSIPLQETGETESVNDDLARGANILSSENVQQNTYLQPINLPQSYKLARIVSDVNDDLTFVYQISGSSKELRICISPVDWSEPKNGGAVYDSLNQENISMSKAAPTKMYSGNDITADDTESRQDTSINILITKNSVTYNVTLSAGIPEQELSHVANLIKFEEETNDDNKE